jgi:branched-chain amino acid transport system permease protein
MAGPAPHDPQAVPAPAAPAHAVPAPAAASPLASPLTARLALAGVLLALALVPLLGSYPTWLVANVLILALFATGLNLLFGYTGLLSFGHAGFFAVGGYVCAKMLLAWPSLLPGLLGGLLAAGVVALVVGYLCVRHTEIYFAMLTLAFGMMIHSIIWKWREVTGGDDGLVGVPRAPLEIPGLFSIELAALGRYYYLVLFVVVGALYGLWRVVNSSLGLTLQGIRDSQSRVAFSGLSVARYRLTAFTLSGAAAGLAGALRVPLETSATPEMAHWTFSAEPVLATLMGGTQSFAGPIVGAMLLYGIKEVVVRYTGNWMLVLGTVVIVLVLGFRGGVVSVLRERVAPWLGARLHRNEGGRHR